MKSLYGLDWEAYNTLLDRQGGKCAICGLLSTRNGAPLKLAVDHDHDTGEVRGLLCDKCNRGLGMFNESKERLQAAIDYLCPIR